MQPLHERLNAMADKINAMWGRHPDADLIREAAAELTPEPEEETPPASTQVKVTKATKKGSKA